MATFDEFFASLDLDEEGNVKKDKTEKGLPFEQIFIRWFLKNDPIWSSIVDEFVETNKKDLGIDLIFKDQDGNKWAVQSKGYSPKTYITKESIDSFISASPTSKFYKRLLIASTDRIGANADITLKENKVVRFLLKDFRNSTIDFPPTIKELSKVKKIKTFSRREHQKKAINDVLKKLESVSRGQVIMACGTGKTLTSLWIKEDLKSKQVLVLVPSLNLLSQTLSSWRSNLSKPFKWQCVCSDKTVHKEKDSEENWINDPLELGIPVTSNIREIKKFLLKQEPKVLFSTYQSSELIVEAQKDKNLPAFDIVFADEAHKCAGKISKEFSYILDNEKIRATKRLFFTATPRVLTKKIKKQALQTETELASMDDDKLFGNVLHLLKFSDAIEQEILTDYQLIVIGIDDKLIAEKINNRDFIKTTKNEIIDSESLALQIAIIKGIKKYDLHRIINFHSRIEGAKFFRDTFEKTINEIPLIERPSGKISCDYVEGKMKTEDRISKIKSLENITENERKILGNARCLSEGVDVPSLDGITFVDPKSSEVDIVQAVGRVIRKGVKEKGTILIPIYLDNLENIEEQTFKSRFSDVWRVIHALKLHDDALKENIDNLRISFGQRRSKRQGFKGLQKIHFDLPVERIDPQFVKSINTLLVENTSETWFERYGELQEYKKEKGNLFIDPKKYPQLGKWANKQRQILKNKKLDKERIHLLNEIGFHWHPDDYKWEEKYNLLKKYINQNKTSKISRSLEPSLSSWAGIQRKLYKDKKLDKERIHLLNEIGFQWDPFDTRWEQNYLKVKKYKEDNNNLKFYDEKELSRWCTKQRKKYSEGNLKPEQIKLLNDIEFEFNPTDSKESEWTKKYYEIKQTLEVNGGNYQNLELSLKKWANEQRKQKRMKLLSTKKIKLLNEIHFIWNTKENDWDEKYNELKRYIKLHGSSLSITRRNEPTIGRWVELQKYQYKYKKLSIDKINLLNKIGFDWGITKNQETKWNEKYNELKEHIKLHGSSLSISSSGNLELAKWTSNQKYRYKMKKLSSNKIKLLNEIGFKWE